MIKRFAMVIWWLGLLSLVAAVVGLLGGLMGGDPGHRLSLGLGIGGLFAFLALCCWALSFILAGAFLRPPALD